MRLRFVDLAVFSLLLVLAIVAQWPAAAVGSWIERGGNGNWRLSAAEGHPWNGGGLLLVRAGDGMPWHAAQQVRWQMQGSELFRGRIVFDVTLEQGSLYLAAGVDGFAVERIDAILPAAELASQLPGALGRYGWSGLLHLQGAGYRCNWAADRCSGDLGLLWRDAAVAEIPGPALGDYRLRLVGEGATLRVDLSTLRGRLQLGGSGEVSAKSARFSGEAATDASNAEGLDALLRTLGRPAGTPGKYLIEYRS